MIELLVGMVIAALIITPMLGFVVNILNSDVREQAKTNSEQELQAAIDYIAQDVSQAVYIYDPDYAGDATSDPAIPSYDDFITQLPYPPAEDASDEKKPVLVFWKRQLVEDVLPVSGDDCSAAGCDDTFVLSLVAYYLIEDNDTTWCQPDGNPCPKRIARFQIQDGVTELSGGYICGDDGLDDSADKCFEPSKQMRDLGFRTLDNTNPTGWTQATVSGGTTPEGYEANNTAVVLLNYIEDFTLNNVTDNKLAKITVVGNALRRIQTDTDCANSPTYCPKATAQVGARSGFGTSE
jgi:type II secretory pathway pseudopilin PulG